MQESKVKYLKVKNSNHETNQRRIQGGYWGKQTDNWFTDISFYLYAWAFLHILPLLKFIIYYLLNKSLKLFLIFHPLCQSVVTWYPMNPKVSTILHHKIYYHVQPVSLIINSPLFQLNPINMRISDDIEIVIVKFLFCLNSEEF